MKTVEPLTSAVTTSFCIFTFSGSCERSVSVDIHAAYHIDARQTWRCA
jgi:hypothetical protein